MFTKSYRLSPLAEQDLEDIWKYTQQTWSTEQADFYHSGLIAAIENLAVGNKVGRDASDVRTSYRKFSVGRHLLFYLEQEAQIDVIRILHQRMNFSARLKS